MSRRSPREEIQGLMDRLHSVHVEPLFRTRRDDIGAEHEVPAIGLGNDHPLRARQAERLTCVAEPFDLFGDGTDGLDMPDLWPMAPVMAGSWRSGTSVRALSRQHISAPDAESPSIPP